jgi:drug/metabolite transporter (DMT)-like permease
VTAVAIRRAVTVAPALALTFNAFAWGVSWWPFRQLGALGLHPLWSTVIVYALAIGLITLARPRAWGALLATPVLWWLVVAAGTTNAAFNWAVTIGDVVRVVLLFYLMPLWAALLARIVLHERLSRWALLRMAMALCGAAIVLWPAHGGFPMPSGLADWLGVLGGFSFALNNVMLRRHRAQPEAVRALAMFAGGMVVAGGLGLALATQGRIAWPPQPEGLWPLGVLALGVWFLLGNLALQYGTARLSAHATAVIMLTEIVFAAASALALGGGVLTAQLALGGAMIMLGAGLAAFETPSGS